MALQEANDAIEREIQDTVVLKAVARLQSAATADNSGPDPGEVTADFGAPRGPQASGCIRAMLPLLEQVVATVPAGAPRLTLKQRC